MVGLAVLFLLMGGHQLLENANDLAALWCAPLTGTARAKKENSVERSSSETLFIEHSSQRLRQQKATHLATFKEGHGYFCRLPAPLFSPL